MKTRRSISQTIRVLHRNIGFFIIGYIIVLALSGIALVFRDSELFKTEKKMQVTLAGITKPSDLGPALRMRELRILKTEGDIIYFQGGTYNQSTEIADYTVKELMFPFNKMTALHKLPSKNPLHWFAVTLGILLFLMAVTSPWMFNAKSRQFKRGMMVAGAGVLFAILLLILI